MKITDEMVEAAQEAYDQAHTDIVGFIWHDGSKLFIRDFNQDNGKIICELASDTKTYPDQHKKMMAEVGRLRWVAALEAALNAAPASAEEPTGMEIERVARDYIERGRADIYGQPDLGNWEHIKTHRPFAYGQAIRMARWALTIDTR